MEHDALGAHARDEFGISDTMTAKPLQAAVASAASFAGGAALPLARWGGTTTSRSRLRMLSPIA